MTFPNRNMHTRRSFIKDSSAAAATVAFFSNIMPVHPSAVEAQERMDNWFKNIYRQI